MTRRQVHPGFCKLGRIVVSRLQYRITAHCVVIYGADIDSQGNAIYRLCDPLPGVGKRTGLNQAALIFQLRSKK